ELGGLIGQRFGAGGGTGNLFAGGFDHLFQNWFWYRGIGDTREYALSNQIFGAAAGNQARLIYLEPTNDGATPNVLLFDLQYTIHDVTPEIPSVHHKCELVIAIKVRNVSPLTQPVEFFSYNDFDLNNTAGNDSAVISGIDNQIQIVRDPGGPGLCRVSAV